MNRVLKILSGVVVSCTLLLLFSLHLLGDELLHVYYLNIGQGDAILIRTPSHENILIDGGPDDSVLSEISAVTPFFERTIDLMILSHPHADHVDGLVEVLRRYKVRQVMITGVSYGYSGYAEFLEEARKQGSEIIFANGVVDYRLGNVVLDIIYPLEPLSGRHFENVNNSSISLRLLYGERGFYFSGDLEAEGEEKLLASGLDVRADVFKAGHHGSRTSSTEPLLDAVRPSWAVISNGVDNSFGHPHGETIAHFQQRGITIYRTDLDGRVEASSDGVDIFFKALNK